MGVRSCPRWHLAPRAPRPGWEWKQTACRSTQRFAGIQQFEVETHDSSFYLVADNDGLCGYWFVFLFYG
jgi:hypothetical protein